MSAPTHTPQDSVAPLRATRVPAAVDRRRFHVVARDACGDEHAEQRATSDRLGAAMARGDAAGPLLDLIAEEAAAAVGGHAARIVRFAEHGRSVVEGVWTAAGAEGWGALEEVESATRHLAAQGSPARRVAIGGTADRLAGTAAWCLPVTMGGGIWGSLSVAATGPAEVGARQAERLASLARLAGLAAADRAVRQLTEAHSTERGALRRVMAALSDGGTAGTLDAVAAEARRLVGACAAMVVRVDGTAATVAGVSGRHPTMPARGRILALDPASALGRVSASGAADQADGLALVPIPADDGVWGVIVAGDFDGGAAPDGWAARLEGLAGIVGMGVGRHEAQAALAQHASTDALTGLASPRAFMERLTAEVAAAGREARPLAVVVVDLDRFRLVNDTHGYEAGDWVLAEVGAGLAAAGGEGALVARTGGGEFAWLLRGRDGITAVDEADRVRRALAQAAFPGIGRLTMSAGVCDLSEAETAGELMRLARVALQWAKTHGRDRACRYARGALELVTSEEQERRLDRARTLAGIRALARAIDAKDPSTHRHSERVAALARDLALASGWTAERAELLAEAGRVHDVGKIGVPDRILLKRGPLTPRERLAVNGHAALGADIVGEALSTEQTAWVRHHHERMDGYGYPDGLAGDAIPPGARILALADAWDAMTAARPYSEPLDPGAAFAECRRSRGRQFSPEAVDALARLWREGRLTGA